MRSKEHLLWYDDKVIIWDLEKLAYHSVPSKLLFSFSIKTTPFTKVGFDSDSFNEKKLQWKIAQNTENPGTFKNLLLMGDNYWGLTYLQNTHKNRFKVVYLDPPYNTGTGEKAFKDTFSHRTWSTLMKNRLELIYPLLNEDGVLFLHLNKVELGYAQVLCDWLFGRQNFITLITWERSQRTLLGQGQTAINDTSEFILLYAKNKKQSNLYQIQRLNPIEKKTFQQYNKILLLGGKKQIITILNKQSSRPISIYSHSDSELKTISLANFTQRKKEIFELYNSNYSRIVRLSNQQQESTLQQKIIQEFPDKKTIYSVSYIPDRGKSTGKKIVKYYFGSDVILFLKDYTVRKNNQLYKQEDMNNFWNRQEIPMTGIAGEGRVIMKRGKKPEMLLKRILDISSRPGDWILDAFSGSGTTGAVAHKTGRHWVMIDFPKPAELIIERLNKVINGKDQDQHAYNGGFEAIIVEVKKNDNLSSG